MRFRREFGHVDTSERPDIEMWVDQPNIVKVHPDEISKWSLNLMIIEADGDVGGPAVAVGAYAERQIPGVLVGHLYKVTVEYSISLDDIEVTLGGVQVMTLNGGSTETKVAYVRAGGDLLKFSHDAGTNYTGAVMACSIEAMDPITPELIPVIPKRIT